MKYFIFSIVISAYLIASSSNFANHQRINNYSNQKCKILLLQYFQSSPKKIQKIQTNKKYERKRNVLLRCLIAYPSISHNFEYELLQNRLIEQIFQIHLEKKTPSTKELKQLLWILKKIPIKKIKKFESYLLTFLHHPLKDIRKHTGKLLIYLNPDPLLPFFAKIANSPNPIERLYMLESLQYFHNENLLPFLTTLLTDPNKTVRIYAMKTISETPTISSQSSYYNVALEDQDNEVQVNVLNIIKQKMNIPFPNKICKMVKSRNSLVQKASLDVIRRYKSKQCITSISSQLIKEKDTFIQKILLQQYISFKKIQNIPLQGIIQILTNYQSITKNNLLIAIYLAGEITNRRLVNYLENILDSSDNQIVVETVYALSKFKKQNLMLKLVKKLNSTDNGIWVQSAILDVLTETPTYKTLLDILIFYQNSSYPPLKYQAYQTLEKLLHVPF